MLQVLLLVVPLFALILLGYLAGRLRHIPIEGLAWLNFFIVYIALPALFFRLLVKTPMSEFANAEFLLATTGTTFFVFAASLLLGRWQQKANLQEATIQGFAGAYGNIGYLGPPLAIAAFGPEAGVPVALIFCLDNSMHFTLAPLLMALGRGPAGGATSAGPRGRDDAASRVVLVWKEWSRLFGGIVWRIVTHPFILATAAGMLGAWYQWQVPDAVDDWLATLSASAAPCALFAMGVTAALRPLKRIPVELSWLLPIKLLIHPALMFVVVSQVPGVATVWIEVAVLMAALPSATNVFVIAQQYGVWEERASSAVALSTALSIVTVTAYLYLSREGYLLA